MHVRLALYKLNGSVEEVVRTLDSPGGMVEIFKESDGFVSYEVASDSDDGLISLSHWETAEQARAATESAAGWVRENMGGMVELQESRTAEVVISAAVD
jgi:heme-degrading monooxygenase HmoA